MEKNNRSLDVLIEAAVAVFTWLIMGIAGMAAGAATIAFISVTAAIGIAAKAGVLWYLWNTYITQWSGVPHLSYLPFCAVLLSFYLVRNKLRDKDDTTIGEQLAEILRHLTLNLLGCLCAFCTMWVINFALS